MNVVDEAYGFDGTVPGGLRCSPPSTSVRGLGETYLCSRRATRGVSDGGRHFEIVDDWTDPDRAHLDLGLRWIGRIAILERADCCLSSTSLVVSSSCGPKGKNVGSDEMCMTTVDDRRCRMRGDVWGAIVGSCVSERWADD